MLEQVFSYFKCSKINVVSGYRTASHDKKVGGRGGGNHVEGKAVDFIAYDQNGKIIPSAKIVLFLEDAGVLGIGYRCGGSVNSTHMDINYRTKKWYGDEKISMSSSIWNIKSGCYSYYDYLGVKRVETKASVTSYQAVITCTALNIRSGAGTKYGVVGSYKRGDKVTITAENEAKTWGKTAKGWISIKPAFVERV